MAAFFAVVLAWSAVAPGVRMASARCAGSRAWVVEVEPGAKFVASSPGPSRTTEEFAAAAGAVVAINGGLFDVRERPMGPSRGAGRDWPLAPRVASAGVFGATAGRAELLPAAAPWMTEVVSGWPWLVSGGKPCAGNCGCAEPLCKGPAARTAVAAAQGKVLLVVVAAPGATLAALAAWLVSLGAESALNLDGGGSTSLVVGGRVLTGGALRAPTHLGVVANR